MDLMDIRAQIEEEITWRQNELRFLKNQLSYIPSYIDKMRYRKSLIVMLYSHYEGFCKTAFLIYIDAVNSIGIKREIANKYLNAASLANVFYAYDDRDKKCKVFKNALPNDEKLHVFSRQVDFVNEINDLWEKIVEIPEYIVDTESNLKPIVLRKILFRLGFPYDCFEEYEGNIHLLINKRNNIAHGSERFGITYEDYLRVERDTFFVMEQIKRLIIKALENREYLIAV